MRSFQVVICYSLVCLAVVLLYTPAEAIPPVDIVFLIDSSGSMKKNDHQHLRLKAAQLFTFLSNNADRITVVDFSTDPVVLVEGMSLSSTSNREHIHERIGSIGNQGDWTDIIAALDTAFQILRRTTDPSRRAAVILLTDGEMSLSVELHQQRYPHDPTYRSYLGPVLAKAQPNWYVYPIALTRKADTPFLRRIARETAGGYFRADSSDELEEIYRKIFSDLYEHFLTIPVHLDENNPLHRIHVSKHIQRLKFVISKSPRDARYIIRKPGKPGDTLDLSDPDMARFSSLGDVDVVEVVDPDPGDWIVELRGEGMLTVDELRRFDFDVQAGHVKSIYRPGDLLPLEVAVVPKDDAQDMGEIRRKLRAQVEITSPSEDHTTIHLYNDGTHGDRRADDLTFSNRYQLRSGEGDYRVRFMVRLVNKGRVYTKEMRRVISVADVPAAAFRLPSKFDTTGSSLTFRVRLESRGGMRPDPSTLADCTVRLLLKDPGGREQTTPLYDDGSHGDQQADDGTYVYTVLAEREGAYTYTVTASVLYRGERFVQRADGTTHIGTISLLSIGKIPRSKSAFELPLTFHSTFDMEVPVLVSLEWLRSRKDPGYIIEVLEHARIHRLVLKKGNNTSPVGVELASVPKPGKYDLKIDLQLEDVQDDP